MKNLLVLIAALSLIGCSTVREDGVCATYAYGACMLKWQNGKRSHPVKSTCDISDLVGMTFRVILAVRFPYRLRSGNNASRYIH
ncbi:hypothetical protein KMB89_gp45 [Citrobacter phage HCF1]|uniref:Lipoprotein n=1 Tax=Citrobacter phage HCF1 TaxID=2849700 RepID=A0ABX6D8Y2_9CAUD|nr:hypothetical protein KMB89_gp45 [Citrobacter phage HCF1]